MKRILTTLVLVLPLAAQVRSDRYALILEDPPVAAKISTRSELRTAAAADRHARIVEAQDSVRAAMAKRKIRVLGSTQVLLNAVYVAASEAEAAGLGVIPGVRRVVPMMAVKRHLNRALDLMNARAAWDQIGGEGNAGAGMKIAILDSGVDQNHPGLRDDSLPDLPGFPRGPQEYHVFTSKKVIVARSYVSLLVLADEPNDSRPDDLSPRDRVGHGTAVAMIAAGVRNTGPAATITGMAPKARIGNYKIFGSPGVNDVTFDDVIFQALEDAFLDGMDVATLAVGSAALWGPLDAGSICGAGPSEACDPRSDMVQRAVSRGMTVVVSAGNDGDLGLEVPALNTIHSPGTAPNAITVGAITNSHQLYNGVRVTEDPPAGLRRVRALLGNGPTPAAPLTAPLRDVSKLGNDGLACEPLANGSLNGALALIQRGDCSFSIKVNNAQQAGALGVIIYQVEGSDFLFPPVALEDTGIPAALIGNTDGKVLKAFLETNPNRNVTIDPSLEEAAGVADEVAYFSSAGPSIGNSAIKPEVVAVGTDIYTATQSFDPSGDLYDATGYTTVQGTSFAVAFVAGAAAMMKQQNPQLTPADIKSKIVNTANEVLWDYDYSGARGPARVTAIGAGKLNAAEALRSNVTIDPPVVSLGAITSASALPSVALTVKNAGSSTVNLTFNVAGDRSGDISITPNSLTLLGGTSQQVTVRLQGIRPDPGQYQGMITVSGGAVPLRIPYLFVRGDGQPFNMVPLRGFDFRGMANFGVPLTFKLIDRYGVPVPDIPVTFRPVLGGGSIERANPATDAYGIAEARVILGPELGEQEFEAEAGNLRLSFIGLARQLPAIESNGVVNAASGQIGQGLAPGSYISIFGRGLSPALSSVKTPWLPYSLAGVSVSFDVPGRFSLPGRLHFVSAGQINVQIPWELQGQTSALMKVSIGNYSSALYTVPLNDYSPGIFEYAEASSGRTLAAALDQNFTVIGTGNPARRGQAIQLYANGLGPLNNQQVSGEPASAEPLARTRATPEVTIGGRPAQVIFSGLAPGFVGLYQVNAIVSGDTPGGVQPIEIRINGITSKAVNTVVE